MKTLIHESQHADENSEMLTPLLEKNKNMTYHGMNAFIITY